MKFKLKFWGVRGSIPTPGKKFSKYGGNTSCIEIEANNNIIILDMGSGIKNLGDDLIKRGIKKFDILLSHFHYDHTCGLPFFSPSFDSEYKFSIRSSLSNERDITFNVLNKQMAKPSFPISLKDFKAKISYIDFTMEKDFSLGEKNEVKIQSIPLNHPEGATGYKVIYGEKSICYLTDHEHIIGKKDSFLIDFVKDSNILIYDSTYRDEDFKKYIGWGHSTWQAGLRLAKEAAVKKFFIFHHNPDYDDIMMDQLLKITKNITEVKTLIAREGLKIKV